MKIGKQDRALSAGDHITVGVTHEIKVDGERSWVKYEVVSAVREDEMTETAKTRVVGHVNATVMEVVHEVVSAVREEN